MIGRSILALSLALGLSLGLGVSGGFAVQPDEILDDPALEERARALSAELRCLVCQNQSIDDSDAPLARDLRILVRERLVAGDSDSDIRGYLVDRYGEFVLLKPPFSVATLLLWLTPVIVVLAGISIIIFRPRAIPTGGLGLSEDEERQLRAVLKERRGDDSQTPPKS